MNTIFTPKTGLAILAFLAGAALLLAQPSRTVAEGDSPGVVLAPVGTGFTYQGHLESSGNPVDGNYDFQFMLFDA